MKSIPNQSDMDSEWCREWLRLLSLDSAGCGHVYHRKRWEVAWMLETMRRHGFMETGMRGVGFGVGLDFIAPLLVSAGHKVLLTDIEPVSEQIKSDWVNTGQHCGGDMLKINSKKIITDQIFELGASFQYLDMNGPLDSLRDFDYCWSLNSMDHLGSIDRAHSFLIRSLETVKPGGLAIHTTELNVTPVGGKEGTYTSDSTVFMLPSHLWEVVQKLQQAGHTVDTIDIESGTTAIDVYVDRPPFIPDNNGSKQYHLKMENNGWVITSVGIAIRKAA